ncbi:hypothetical protein N658DRAFT_491801 [Parathielavia hyrcaniae]|uniref:Uncharacterized protein n=1 Tax=Parathielavia hyrcaniae TaxID=113614 RepID=A0AAN6QAS1_9PEZI|nr:hypothetical protein N658DRAFT_491801 [Parathielavia hyrcaniae]
MTAKRMPVVNDEDQVLAEGKREGRIMREGGHRRRLRGQNRSLDSRDRDEGLGALKWRPSGQPRPMKGQERNIIAGCTPDPAGFEMGKRHGRPGQPGTRHLKTGGKHRPGSGSDGA